VALGASELIATNESTYVQLAINLPPDSDALAQMQQNLRSKWQRR
tara:strand:+ start:603 stop:737 length:135 start_codon:yes stop_codon:yes gene_type:complete